MAKTKTNYIKHGDSTKLVKDLKSNSIHCIISDIPYGISYDEWDVLHDNSNSALLGSSPAQKNAKGNIFKHRGKPLNGWSEKDKQISKEYYNWCCSWASEWLRVVKPCASVFIFAGRRYSHRCICALEDSGFIFKDMIAWKKSSAAFRSQRVSVAFDKRGDTSSSTKWQGWRLGNLRPIFEPILWFIKPYKVGTTILDSLVKRKLGAFNDLQWNSYCGGCSSNIISVSPDKRNSYHPTQKPLNLIKALIELVTIENQIVLDPFCGSGTTCVAANELNRRYIGFELNKDYVSIARSRISGNV